MIAWLKALWAASGTRILGYGGAAVTALTLLDHETINLIGTCFGPLWAPRVTHGLALAGSLAVAYRGHVNSRHE